MTCQPAGISIHALLAESDFHTVQVIIVVMHDFYPRSPCGERPLSGSSRATVLVFLSTLSLRRATFSMYGALPAKIFLSTLSLRRATKINGGTYHEKSNFYPRSPCGERPVVDNIVFMSWKFLSTLSLRRATLSIVFK